MFWSKKKCLTLQKISIRRATFKGYLCYKTITPQNVLSARNRLRIFLFCRKVIFHSQGIQVFVLLAIPRFRKSLTSWWVLVHETGCIFEYIFWTTTHWPIKLGQLIDVSKGNIFLKNFEWFRGFGESGTEETSTIPTQHSFYPVQQQIEEKVKEYNAVPSKNIINESYFLYDKSGLIKESYITAINKKSFLLWVHQLFWQKNRKRNTKIT